MALARIGDSDLRAFARAVSFRALSRRDMASSAAFLYRNGCVVTRNEKRSPAEVLRSLPRGVYTTLRVEKLKRVVDWNLHLARIERCELGSRFGLVFGTLSPQICSTLV